MAALGTANTSVPHLSQHMGGSITCLQPLKRGSVHLQAQARDCHLALKMKICKSPAFTGFALSLIAGKSFHLLHPHHEDQLAVCLLRRGIHAHVCTQPAETSLPYLFPQTIEKLDQLVPNIQAVSSTQNKQRTSILPMSIASGKRDTKTRVFKIQDNVICDFVQKAELCICGSEKMQKKSWY